MPSYIVLPESELLKKETVISIVNELKMDSETSYEISKYINDVGTY